MAHNRMLNINADNYKKSLQMLETDKQNITNTEKCCDKVPYGECVTDCPSEKGDKGNRNHCDKDSNKWVSFNTFAKENCPDLIQYKIKQTKNIINNITSQMRDESENVIQDLHTTYKHKSDTIKDKIDHSDTANMLLTHQDKVMTNNNDYIVQLDGDLNTTQRKIQVYENEYRKKSKYIFVLKNIFTSLLITILLTMLVNNKILDQKTAIYIGSIICSVITLSVIYSYNLYNSS